MDLRSAHKRLKDPMLLATMPSKISLNFVVSSPAKDT